MLRPVSLASSRSPSSVAELSSTTTSPLIKGRPIRPLPKKPLRSRLSPEVAQSITYPPAPKISRPWYYSPNDEQETLHPYGSSSRDLSAVQSRSSAAQHIINGSLTAGHAINGLEQDSDDDLSADRSARGRTPSIPVGLAQSQVDGTGSPRVTNGDRSQRLSAAPSIESVDGYDSFENTNNKKKRKIPTGSFQAQHSLSSSMAQMNISSPRYPDGALPLENTFNQKLGAGMPSQANMGMGRGGGNKSALKWQTTRNAGGRSPLGVSINGSNAMQTARSTVSRHDERLNDRGKLKSARYVINGLM